MNPRPPAAPALEAALLYRMTQDGDFRDHVYGRSTDHRLMSEPVHVWTWDLIAQRHQREEDVSIGTLIPIALGAGRREYAAALSDLPVSLDTAPRDLGTLLASLERLREARDLLALSDLITYEVHRRTPLGDIRETVLQRLASIATGEERDFTDSPALANMMIEYAQDREHRAQNGLSLGLATGYRALDAKIGPLEPGNMVVIAGRPGMGKSALAMGIMANVCDLGARVALFSLEMPDIQIALRMAAQLEGIPTRAVRDGNLTPRQHDRLHKAVDRISEWNLYTDETPGVGMGHIAAKARKLARRLGGLELVVIDHIHLMSYARGEDEVRGLTSISKGCKGLAKELDCPTMPLAQLNRALEQRQDKRPMMSDLRGCGSIEQDADLVLFPFRPGYYLDEERRKQDPIAAERFDELAEVVVGKHREGKSPRVYGDVLRWMGGRYVEYE